MLRTLYSRGVLEVRWRDDRGVRRSEPQVDLDLYFMPERRTAFRASKVSENYLWLGSDDDHFWVFDLTGEERLLIHAAHDAAAAGRHDELSLHPLLIRDLMGLVWMPAPENGEHPTIAHSRDRDAWVVVVPATTPGWRIRLYLDRVTGLPKRAEGLAQDGRVAFTSEIGRYRRATQEGMASVLFPWMPTLIDVTADDLTGGVSRIDVKISLDSPTGRVANHPMDRVFDLERLKRSLRPERIEAW
jgi:hypothetical protein